MVEKFLEYLKSKFTVKELASALFLAVITLIGIYPYIGPLTEDVILAALALISVSYVYTSKWLKGMIKTMKDRDRS